MGFFSHWARLQPLPQRGWYFVAQFYRHPNKIGRLRVFVVPPIQQVSNLPVLEELTRRWHDIMFSETDFGVGRRRASFGNSFAIVELSR